MGKSLFHESRGIAAPAAQWALHAASALVMTAIRCALWLANKINMVC